MYSSTLFRQAARHTIEDLGFSWYNREEVNQIIQDAAPVTASLVFGGAIFWLCSRSRSGSSALRPRSLLTEGR